MRLAAFQKHEVPERNFILSNDKYLDGMLDSKPGSSGSLPTLGSPEMKANPEGLHCPLGGLSLGTC